MVEGEGRSPEVGGPMDQSAQASMERLERRKGYMASTEGQVATAVGQATKLAQEKEEESQKNPPPDEYEERRGIFGIRTTVKRWLKK